MSDPFEEAERRRREAQRAETNRAAVEVSGRSGLQGYSKSHGWLQSGSLRYLKLPSR